MKKLFSMLLTVIMVLSLAVPVLAEDETKGSITINGSKEGNVYSIYKLLDLMGYDNEKSAYSYKVNSKWTDFFKDVDGADVDAMDFVQIDRDGYVTWKAAKDDATYATFAKLALSYAKANRMTAVESSKDDIDDNIIVDNTGTSLTFSNLELGYYLIDSTMGALCGLTTTKPTATINAKNGAPTLEKLVKEDSTGNFSTSNTADIGQEIEFQVTINVHDGAENYVFHDTMTEGLTFDPTSLVIQHNNHTTENTDSIIRYELDTAPTDGCTFDIKFTEYFCNSLSTNDKIYITYKATVNEKASIGNTDPDTNTAKLGFGDDHTTNPSITKTYTYGFDIVKTNATNTLLLNGAVFEIYDVLEDGNAIQLIKVVDNGGVVSYRRATDKEITDETVDKVTEITVNGHVRLTGFDNGDYYLYEVKAPAGYNQLSARQKFTIADDNKYASFNGSEYASGSGIHVQNNTGAILPETGGFGTTMFILIGSLLALTAGVLLVTQKRVAKIMD